MSKETNFKDDFLVRASELGWQIVAEDADGIQMKRPKVYASGMTFLGLICTVLAMAFYFTGLVIDRVAYVLFAAGVCAWIFGWVDFLNKRHEFIYIVKSELMGTEHAPKIMASIQ